MGSWRVTAISILARKRAPSTSSMRHGLIETQALAGFGACGGQVILETGLSHQITKENVGNLAAGRQVAGIMYTADHPVMRIIIGAIENFPALLRNNPYQSERLEIADDGMSAGVGVGSGNRLANGVQRAIELVRTRALELAFERGGDRGRFARHPFREGCQRRQLV